MAPRAEAAKSAKKSKKSSGHKEMLMPIEGKKLKEATAKKIASKSQSARNTNLKSHERPNETARHLPYGRHRAAG
jgi:hypothetical protein